MTALDICSLLARGLTIGQTCKRLGVERWRIDQMLEGQKREWRAKTTFQLMAAWGDQVGAKRRRDNRERMRKLRRGKCQTKS